MTTIKGRSYLLPCESPACRRIRAAASLRIVSWRLSRAARSAAPAESTPRQTARNRRSCVGSNKNRIAWDRARCRVTGLERFGIKRQRRARPLLCAAVLARTKPDGRLAGAERRQSGAAIRPFSSTRHGSRGGSSFAAAVVGSSTPQNKAFFAFIFLSPIFLSFSDSDH